jgi:hypothetical protein
VLDTAAQVTTIDPELAAELRLKMPGQTGVTGAGFSTRGSYTRLDSLETGAYQVKNPLLLIHNLGQIHTDGKSGCSGWVLASCGRRSASLPGGNMIILLLGGHAQILSTFVKQRT